MFIVRCNSIFGDVDFVRSSTMAPAPRVLINPWPSIIRANFILISYFLNSAGLKVAYETFRGKFLELRMGCHVVVPIYTRDRPAV